MKQQLVGTINLKPSGHWLANLYVQEREYGGEYVAERCIQGQPKLSWTCDKLQDVLDCVEAWADMGEVYAAPIKKQASTPSLR